jgi:nitrate/nitrite transporter NarK
VKKAISSTLDVTPPWSFSAAGLETQRQSSVATGARKNDSFWRVGHWPTPFTAFLYFDFSFMAWTLLGTLGPQIGESLHLSAEKKGLMVAVPILSGAVLRSIPGLAVDRFGAKATGITAQIVVIAALLCASVKSRWRATWGALAQARI